MKTIFSKKELWLRLHGYHFRTLVPENLWDEVVEFFGGKDAATKAFADKLARKHNWDTDFALLAISEYKKFIYLGVTAGFPVTPSQVIDTVWHEHILFTQGYRDFCTDTIGCDFNHYPELLVNPTQTKAYRKQYKRTIDLYTYEFNAAPPDDIWGATKFGRRSITKQKREENYSTYDSTSTSNIPLFAFFDSTVASADSGEGFGGFGGGDSGGGGAGSDWADDSGVDSDGDAGGSDGDSGGDSSCGGDSGGCSSGCGGSCGGD